MVSPDDVIAFHADYDRHPDDRVRLFAAIKQLLPHANRVLYPGSYVDIASSVWFDEVAYLDLDRRAARFFAQPDQVAELVARKRSAWGGAAAEVTISFHHQDYGDPIDLPPRSQDLLVSLYAGLVSAHCTELLAIGGHLLVNPSHGDVAMASIDERYALAAVVRARAGEYRTSDDDLDTYLIPKQSGELTRAAVRARGRGIAYTRTAFAYVFQRVR